MTSVSGWFGTFGRRYGLADAVWQEAQLWVIWRYALSNRALSFAATASCSSFRELVSMPWRMPRRSYVAPGRVFAHRDHPHRPAEVRLRLAEEEVRQRPVLLFAGEPEAGEVVGDVRHHV